MIGRLQGVVVERDPTDGCCILDVRGVGYEVFVPLRCLRSLPAPPEEVTVHVHTHVREEALTLFAFTDSDDRLTFRALTSVSGVGPKLAMAILGELSTGELGDAVHRGDQKRLNAISGVGKKLAARLALELKEKVAPGGAGAGGGAAAEGVQPPAPDGVGARATEVLMQMGFGRGEAERAVAQVAAPAGEADAAVEVVLRKALAVLG